MNSRKINKAQRQTADQTVKGGIMGLLMYVAMQYNVDPGLIAASTPVVAGILAWLSTKIGDPELACLFIGKEDKPKK
jgi:hypothetical protein